MINALKNIYEELGISKIHLSHNRLPPCEQAPFNILEIVEIDFEGRPFILTRGAAVAWRDLCKIAESEDVSVQPFSGFRSYIYQKQLIRRKLDKGRSLELILTETAIPGFSEHHTGRAVDICTEGKYELNEAFDQTQAFMWLKENAHRFDFSLSYPQNNNTSIIYEPWHWLYRG